MTEANALLLVDIGNSRVKWGWARGGRIAAGEPFATRAGAFPREWADALPPAQIVVANVAGEEIAAALRAWTLRHWQAAPRFVRSEAQGGGVVNGYAAPAKLGVDRWAALAGARRACPGPVCVADLGTAVTFDALDGAGRHLGGLIAPGLALMRGALARGTSGLLLAGGEAQAGLARDTAAAIAAGTLAAAAGLLEHALRDAARQFGEAPRLLLTGGDAPAVARVLAAPCELRPDLVLEGLLAIASGPP